MDQKNMGFVTKEQYDRVRMLKTSARSHVCPHTYISQIMLAKIYSGRLKQTAFLMNFRKGFKD